MNDFEWVSSAIQDAKYQLYKLMKFRSNENDTAASTFPFLFSPLLSISLSCPFFTDFLLLDPSIGRERLLESFLIAGADLG